MIHSRFTKTAMLLRIQNFAKIRSADVQMNGLTVICGLNNTGKSTVGKVLHSVFNSLQGIDAAVAGQRRKHIKEELNAVLDQINNERAYYGAKHLYFPSSSLVYARKFDSYEQLLEYVTRKLENDYALREKETITDHAGLIAKAIWDAIILPEEKVRMAYVESYFRQMFGDQIVSVYDDSVKASVELQIRQDSIFIEFDENRCVCLENPVKIVHRSIYIDNPYIVDALSDDKYARYGGVRPAEKELASLLRIYKRARLDTRNAYKRTLVSEKLTQVEERFANIMHGRIVSGAAGLELQQDGGGSPLRLLNLSLGLKSFVVLYMLLDSLKLQKKDVLVLDEPEIHLHTEWQVRYAEIIVLLQKYFDLSVVVTTHSPYFLDALEQYAVKYGTIQNASFYLSQDKGGYVDMEDVTGQLNKIYDKITPSLAALKQLRYENDNPGTES